MPLALLDMEDFNYFSTDLGGMRDSFGSDSLSALHTAWLDDEQLNNSLPLMDDVFGDTVAAQMPTDTQAGNSEATGAQVDQHTALLSPTSVRAAEQSDYDSQHLLDEALAVPEFSFDEALSPILEPFDDASFDKKLQAPKSLAAASPAKPLRRSSRSPRAKKVPSGPSPRQAATLTGLTLPQDESVVSVPASPNVSKRRPRVQSVVPAWTEQEQNSFFSIFKSKWPPTLGSQQPPPFSTLLLQRFDVISKKVKTKSVNEVRRFYTSVMQHIADLLRDIKHDIDLANPDEVRIAVWCWSKLLSDKKRKEEVQTLDSAPPSVKTHLANVLLQSIIRSRRQMLKAKPDYLHNPSSLASGSVAQSVSTVQSKSSNPGLTFISSWIAQSNSSVFSAPQRGDPSVPVHHPTVRKKHPAPLQASPAAPSGPSQLENTNTVLSLPRVQQPIGQVLGGAALKRKRDGSLDLASATASADMTGPAEKRKRLDAADCAAFTSPPPTKKRTGPNSSSDVAFQTPQRISRKKIYIKMRMVPRDKQTKADVVHCGCRPKVELKLSSTKKISEVAAHMSKKWAKVLPMLPAGAVLRFFQKSSAVHSAGWSKEDSSVTCFDIWRQCGKQVNGENVVEVSYLWEKPKPAVATSVSTSPDGSHEFMPLGAPPGLFEQEVTAASRQKSKTSAAGKENGVEDVSPAHGLQKYGEKMAFERGMPEQPEGGLLSGPNSGAGVGSDELAALIGDFEDDVGEEFSPNTGRRRRRITPVLVSKEEFKI